MTYLGGVGVDGGDVLGKISGDRCIYFLFPY
jgi:hypothetical protein